MDPMGIEASTSSHASFAPQSWNKAEGTMYRQLGAAIEKEALFPVDSRWVDG